MRRPWLHQADEIVDPRRFQSLRYCFVQMFQGLEDSSGLRFFQGDVRPFGRDFSADVWDSSQPTCNCLSRSFFRKR